jgi:hypothetical protein
MTFYDFIKRQYNGELKTGLHDAGSGAACGLEALSQYQGDPWTDDPQTLRCFDIRKLNDAPWESDAQRAKYVALVIDAIRGSLDWSSWRQHQFVWSLTLETVRQVLSVLPMAKGGKRLSDVHHRVGAQAALQHIYPDMTEDTSKTAAIIQSVLNDGMINPRIAAARIASVAPLAAMAVNVGNQRPGVNMPVSCPAAVLKRACHAWVQAEAASMINPEEREDGR